MQASYYPTRNQLWKMCRTTFSYYFSGIINTLRVEPDILSSVKRGLYLTQTFEVAATQILTSQSRSLSANWLF